MQISTKQRFLRAAAGSIFAAGTVLIPAAAASADSEGHLTKGPPEMPELPTDPAEGLPIPNPGNDS